MKQTLASHINNCVGTIMCKVLLGRTGKLKLFKENFFGAFIFNSFIQL